MLSNSIYPKKSPLLRWIMSDKNSLYSISCGWAARTSAHAPKNPKIHHFRVLAIKNSAQNVSLCAESFLWILVPRFEYALVLLLAWLGASFVSLQLSPAVCYFFSNRFWYTISSSFDRRRHFFSSASPFTHSIINSVPFYLPHDTKNTIKFCSEDSLSIS